MGSTVWILGAPSLLLGLVGWASTAAAQSPRPAEARLRTAGPVTHLGRYDLATGEIVPAGAEEGGTAGATLVYDQSEFLFGDPPGGTYLAPTPDQIDMDWGILAAGCPNAIVRIQIGYGTTAPGSSGSIDPSGTSPSASTQATPRSSLGESSEVSVRARTSTIRRRTASERVSDPSRPRP